MAVNRDNVVSKVVSRATGGTYYAQFAERDTGKIFDISAKANSLSTTWENAEVTITESETDLGRYPIVVPEGLPKEIYDVTMFVQAGSEPAVSDEISFGYEHTEGSIFGF